MEPGFAPGCEVFAIVEQEIVILFAEPTHGSAESHTNRRLMLMLDNANGLILTKFLQ